MCALLNDPIAHIHRNACVAIRQLCDLPGNRTQFVLHLLPALDHLHDVLGDTACKDLCSILGNVDTPEETVSQAVQAVYRISVSGAESLEAIVQTLHLPQRLLECAQHEWLDDSIWGNACNILEHLSREYGDVVRCCCFTCKLSSCILQRSLVAKSLDADSAATSRFQERLRQHPTLAELLV